MSSNTGSTVLAPSEGFTRAVIHTSYITYFLSHSDGAVQRNFDECVIYAYNNVVSLLFNQVAKMPTMLRSKTPSGNDTYITVHVLRVVTAAFAIFTLIALISYHKQDPGFTQTIVENGIVLNREGLVGAWIADFLYYFIGVNAFLVPVLLLVAMWCSLRARQYLNQRVLCGVCLLLMSLNGLIALHVPTYQLLPAGLGGASGEYIAWHMVEVFNVLGTTFMLLLAVYIGLICINPHRHTVHAGRYFLSGYNHCVTALKQIPIRDVLKQFKPKEVSKSMPKAPSVETKSPTNESMTPELQSAIDHAVDIPKTPDALPNKNTHQATLKMRQTGMHYARVSMPNESLLDKVEQNQKIEIAKSIIINLSRDVEKKFLDFGIKLDVVAVYPGPVVTRFELKLAPGTKVSSISNLSKDLARTLSVTSVRIVDVIPGKSVIGLEIPNTKRQIVRLRDLIASNSFHNAKSPVTIVLGKDISGHPVVVDLAKMPHLLVAGTTGSGKSVGLNAMLISFLYKSSCENLRMILIDPKMLELSVYDDIPHLLTPVITDMREAAGALRWCVAEMERRYKLMSILGVRNIAGYNEKVAQAIKEGAPLLDPLFTTNGDETAPELQSLPAIVVVADEYADMIMVLGKKVEQLIARLAQKARAAGIHLILATQRPSVNVVTGLIKANIPTRIAFQVSSRIDSRTVLDQQGAEQLLGHGDMLYLPPGTGVPIRVHGAYVSDDEVHRVVKYIKENNPSPEYVHNILETFDMEEEGASAQVDSRNDGEKDALYDEAVAIVAKTRKASISSIQRKLKIGYNRSANIVETMEKAGVVSAPSHSGVREVLINEILD